MNTVTKVGLDQGDWSHLPDVPPDRLQPRSLDAGYWVLPATYRSGICHGPGISLRLILRGAIGFKQQDRSGRWCFGRAGANRMVVSYSAPFAYWVEGGQPANFFQCIFQAGAGDLASGVPTMPGIGRLPRLIDVGAEREHMSNCFETLIESHMAARPTWPIRTRAVLLEMLSICFGLGWDGKPIKARRKAKRHLDRWDRLLAWLENTETMPSVAQMACEAGLSVNACIRGFARRVGVTPQKYLQARRLSRAHARLLEGASVKEAAFDAGYHDQLYFSRQYRRFFGHAPSEAKRSGHSKSLKAIPPVYGHKWAPDLDVAAFVRKAYIGKD